MSTYSTSETSTGDRWINGRTIYRKVVTAPAGPNVVQLSLPHGINNIDQFVSVRGFMIGPNKTIVPLPYVGDSLDFVPNTCVSLLADETNVYITPVNGLGQDWSPYSVFVILEFVRV